MYADGVEGANFERLWAIFLCEFVYAQ